MITCFSRQKHSYTFQCFIDEWQAAHRQNYTIQAYEALRKLNTIPAGVLVFADVDRLRPLQRVLASSVRDAVAAAMGEDLVLNHPEHSLRRHDLLTVLCERGINDYRAVRASEPRGELRFPVFVRRADNHFGPLTPLLDTHERLDEALIDLTMGGFAAETLLVVEFCDTRSRDGMFRKYAAQRIGDRVFASHILFGAERWAVNETEIKTEATAAEERAFIEENPHEVQLREIFDLARIQYGRIDYAMRDDRIQVWEINTNPMLAFPRGHYNADRIPLRQKVCDGYGGALAELARRAPTGTVTVDLSREVVMGLKTDGRLPNAPWLGHDTGTPT